jgi:hypothetical protein
MIDPRFFEVRNFSAGADRFTLSRQRPRYCERPHEVNVSTPLRCVHVPIGPVEIQPQSGVIR